MINVSFFLMIYEQTLIVHGGNSYWNDLSDYIKRTTFLKYIFERRINDYSSIFPLQLSADSKGSQVYQQTFSNPYRQFCPNFVWFHNFIYIVIAKSSDVVWRWEVAVCSAKLLTKFVSVAFYCSQPSQAVLFFQL